MTDALLRFLVPRDWTGQQALAAVRLLRSATDVIWQVHGEEMLQELGSVRPADPRWRSVVDEGDLDAAPRPPELSEDDIPY